MENYRILLGSGSPRRRQLLTEMDIPFEPIKIKDIDESYPAGMPAHEVPEFLSLLKADAYRSEMQGRDLLITADTVVISSGQILGKPKTPEDATKMLRSLSGRWHEVVTGVTLSTQVRSTSFSECTRVHFSELSEDQIAYYVDKFKPMDKAGAYGIQEWIGMIGISKIDGCFYNVMGLPTSRLYRELSQFVNSLPHNICYGTGS